MRVAENYYGVPGNFIGRWRNFGKSLRMAVLLTNQYLQKCLLRRRFVPYLACLRWPKIATAISQCADIEFLAPGTKECNHGCNHLSPRPTWPVYSYKLNITTPPYMRASFGKQ